MKKIDVVIYKIDEDPQKDTFNEIRLYYYKHIYWSYNRVIYFHWTEEKTSYFLVFDDNLIIGNTTFIFNQCSGRMKSFPGLTKIGKFSLPVPKQAELDSHYLSVLGTFVTCGGIDMSSYGSYLFDTDESEIQITKLLEKLAIHVITECT